LEKLLELFLVVLQLCTVICTHLGAKLRGEFGGLNTSLVFGAGL